MQLIAAAVEREVRRRSYYFWALLGLWPLILCYSCVELHGGRLWDFSDQILASDLEQGKEGLKVPITSNGVRFATIPY